MRSCFRQSNQCHVLVFVVRVRGAVCSWCVLVSYIVFNRVLGVDHDVQARGAHARTRSTRMVDGLMDVSQLSGRGRGGLWTGR